MKLFRRLRTLFRKDKLDAEMSEEMRAHLELQTAENERRGMAADEARHAARRTFGGEEQIKERCRDERHSGWLWLEHWLRDFRLAARSLRRAPGFSVAVLATLALCIGPNTAILSVLYTLLLKPLPVPGGERVVLITNVATKAGGAKTQSSLAQYLDYRAHADVFDALVAFTGQSFTFGEENSPIRVEGMRAGPEWFELQGQRPRAGRFFTAEEQEPGRDHVVVLTEQFWASQYHSDPAVVGREVRMGGENYTIVGVAPKAGDLMATLKVITPLVLLPYAEQPAARYLGEMKVVGRLKPGVTLGVARAHLAMLERRFYETRATPPVRAQVDKAGLQVDLTPARDELVRDVKTPLLLLQTCAAFVLLIGCVNVVNLLLARANAKKLEFAVRHALGAGRGALLRQMLAESLILTVLAAGLGTALAYAMMDLFTFYLPRILRGAPPLGVDAHVLGFVGAGAVVMAVAVGIVPFFALLRSGLRVGDTRVASAGKGTRAVSGALVMLQVAFALVLLIGAGLLLHSMTKVLAIDPGFDATRVVQGRVALPMVNYRTPEAQVTVQQRVLAAVQTIPGVETAAVTGDFALSAAFRPSPFVLHNRAEPGGGQNQEQMYLQAVSPEYFAAMGIRLLEGRLLTAQDDVRTAPAFVVDQAFAQKYFPGRSALGEEMVPGLAPPAQGKPWPRIVGVVTRANLAGLEARDGWPFVYYPINQLGGGAFTLLLRSSRPAAEVVADMRSKLREIDPALPLYAEGTLQSGLDNMLASRRAVLAMLGVLAAMALLLATLGLHGVLTYDVSQRTRELGIRAALGATRAQIVRLVLREGLWRTGIGLAVGLVVAFGVTRALQKFLFDVTATDPVAFVGVSLLLLGAALLACWLPARRAARVDPVVALRSE